MTTTGKVLRLALIQLKIGLDKSQNLSKIKTMVEEASSKADIICLPECCNSPYGVDFFAEYAEKIPSGETTQLLSALSKQFSIPIIGGSIPEEENGKLYNTCCVFDSSGTLIDKHRKIHLCDIDIPGGITFTESAVLFPGDKATIVDIGSWKIGIGICYDIRFRDLSTVYENEGCHLIIYPSAFNMTTGPIHWELLTRGRANDHQLYVAQCCGARDENAFYVTWGHSMICDPMGKVMAELDHEEGIVYASLDKDEIEKVRKAIPIRYQKREDVYGK